MTEANDDPEIVAERAGLKRCRSSLEPPHGLAVLRVMHARVEGGRVLAEEYLPGAILPLTG